MTVLRGQWISFLLENQTNIVLLDLGLVKKENAEAAFLACLHQSLQPTYRTPAQQADYDARRAAQYTPAAQPGDIMPDGTIYAGISPDTKQRVYTAPADVSMRMDFQAAANYAKNLDAHGHKDWRVPTEAELNVLFQNREKGALKETFNLTGSITAGWYWSSSPNGGGLARCQRLSDGHQSYDGTGVRQSVRCVRS